VVSKIQAQNLIGTAGMLTRQGGKCRGAGGGGRCKQTYPLTSVLGAGPSRGGPLEMYDGDFSCHHKEAALLAFSG
jgi:hypothetical protein